MIRLYDFAHGARGLRVAWLCEEMSLAHAYIPISYPPDDSYFDLSPLGTVPYLQDDQVSMSESVAIMLYLVQRYGPTSLLPDVDHRDYARVLQFTIFGEAALSSPMTPLLAARFGAPENHKRNWSVTGIEHRLKKTIDFLANEIGEREFVAGDCLSLADISIVTAMRIWTGGLGRQLPPAIATYCSHLRARPAFLSAVSKHGGA